MDRRLVLHMVSGFMSKSRGSLSTPRGLECMCNGGSGGQGLDFPFMMINPPGVSLSRAGMLGADGGGEGYSGSYLNRRS